MLSAIYRKPNYDHRISSPRGRLQRFTLAAVDPQIADAIRKERRRQFENIELIASENFTSRAVMEAQGSCLTNKYAEGYPGRRWYRRMRIHGRGRDRWPSSVRRVYSPLNTSTCSLTAAARQIWQFTSAVLQPGDRHLDDGPRPWRAPHRTAIRRTFRKTL